VEPLDDDDDVFARIQAGAFAHTSERLQGGDRREQVLAWPYAMAGCRSTNIEQKAADRGRRASNLLLLELAALEQNDRLRRDC